MTPVQVALVLHAMTACQHDEVLYSIAAHHTCSTTNHFAEHANMVRLVTTAGCLEERNWWECRLHELKSDGKTG